MAGPSTLVQDLETSGRPSLHQSFQAFRVSFLPAEWSAVRSTYLKLDTATGQSRTETLDNCRQFAWFVRNKETGKVRVAANCCRLRWCPLCAKAKKMFVAHNLREWLNYADHPKMLTLTLLHTDEPLPDQINWLYFSFQKLRRAKLFRTTVTGGVWFFQIKYNSRSKQWHPHLHCLITGNYIPQRPLSRLWLQITHTSNIVDIRPVRDFEKAAYEVSCYIARPSQVHETPDEKRTELFTAMHGRRICGSWGTGREVDLHQKKDLDSGNWERLGRWNTIRETITTNPDANDIYQAFLTNTPLPPDISLMEIEDFLDNTPLELEPEPPPLNLFEGF